MTFPFEQHDSGNGGRNSLMARGQKVEAMGKSEVGVRGVKDNNNGQGVPDTPSMNLEYDR